MQHRSLLAALAVMGLMIGATAAVDAAPAKKAETMTGPAHEMAKPMVDGPALTPEKQTLLRTIMDESEARLAPLKEQMYAKRLELKALAQNPNTPRETITTLSQEIASLATRIRDEMRNCKLRIEKEVGVMPHPKKMKDHKMGRMMDDRGCDGCGQQL